MAQTKSQEETSTRTMHRNAQPAWPQMNQEPMEHPGQQQDPRRNSQEQPGHPQRDLNDQDEDTTW